MNNIFAKIEAMDEERSRYTPGRAITDVWRQVSEDLYVSLLDSRKLNARDFRRLQDKIGASAFIVEVKK